MFSIMFFLCYFFFFKQKTAYEMRISDWSSDVCSSDLCGRAIAEAPDTLPQCRPTDFGARAMNLHRKLLEREAAGRPVRVGLIGPGKRSEERRGGKECVSPCRSRGSPYPKKHKRNITSQITSKHNNQTHEITIMM